MVFIPGVMSPGELSTTFFLQMAVILAACRAVGMLARRLGQPQVVGEMIAGVFLGPSLLGALAPGLQAWLFPPDSLKVLYVGGQLGVGIYMFLVGLGFRKDFLRSRIRGAASVSLAGMGVPFLVGAAMAPWLVRTGGLFDPRTSTVQAGLFIGACIAITAFPMLARIIHERGLTATSLGTLAIAAGAIDDVAAWCVLAVVVAGFSGDWTAAWMAIGIGATYALLAIFVLPQALAGLARPVEAGRGVTPTILGFTLLLFCLGAWAMDAVGIHAVFGGFLMGTAMPRGRFTEELRQKLEPLVVVFLLPMFFTYSGLRTELDVLTAPAYIVPALALLAASVLGKGVACWGAALLNGEPQRTALAIGTLMNARGLMELIIINIGRDAGVILAPYFSIMVVMAILTTLMASPLFEWVYGRHARAAGSLEALDSRSGD